MEHTSKHAHQRMYQYRHKQLRVHVHKHKSAYVYQHATNISSTSSSTCAQSRHAASTRPAPCARAHRVPRCRGDAPQPQQQQAWLPAHGLQHPPLCAVGPAVVAVGAAVIAVGAAAAAAAASDICCHKQREIMQQPYCTHTHTHTCVTALPVLQPVIHPALQRGGQACRTALEVLPPAPEQQGNTAHVEQNLV